MRDYGQVTPAFWIGETGKKLRGDVNAQVLAMYLPPQQAPAAPTKTGTRLPEDWTLPNEWRDWAIEARPDIDAETVADSFRDFWVAKPGKDGRKADWQATWRNWVRNQKTAGSLFSAKSANATFAGAI